MGEKQSTSPPPPPPIFSALTDEEVLRLNDPVSRLECELYFRLSHCLAERDAILAEFTKELELAHDDLDNARTAITDCEKSYINIRDAHDELKRAAQRLIDCWEQRNLADAVNELRHVMAQR